ncbi:N/A [soil metagenome]
METHVALLFRHDASGRMVTVNQSGGPPAPRVFVGRTLDGNIYRFRHDLPASLASELEAILATEPVADDLRRPPATFPQLRDALEAHAPVERIWQGPAYRFPERVSLRHDIATSAVSDAAMLRHRFPGWTADLAESQPCAAVVQGGDAVAVCCSSRNSSRAAEAGVDTAAEFRGRGFGSAAVSAWAQAVRESGREPLYSTSWDNHASQAVARRLGLVQYGADLHFT